MDTGRLTPATRPGERAENPVLNVIATVVVFAALAYMGPVVVPLAFAITLSVAVSPLADRIEGVVHSRIWSSLVCTWMLAELLCGAVALISSQVAGIVGLGDEYLFRLGEATARLSDSMGGQRILRSAGILQDAAEPKNSDAAPESEEGARRRAAHEWVAIFRRNAAAVGGWVMSRLGGFVGFLASSAICLSLIFYMLLQRSH